MSKLTDYWINISRVYGGHSFQFDSHPFQFDSHSIPRPRYLEYFSNKATNSTL